MNNNDYNEELFQSRLKCEENNLEMLKKTLGHMIEIGSNNTGQVEELVKESQNAIAFLKKCIETKSIPDDGLTHDTREPEFFDFDDDYSSLLAEKSNKFTKSLVKSNDFSVWFDDISIDGSYVKSVQRISSEHELEITMYLYCKKEDGNNGILEYVVDRAVGSRIGTIVVQTPGRTDNDNDGYSIRYNGCKLFGYWVSGNDYNSYRPMELTLRITYDEAVFDF